MSRQKLVDRFVAYAASAGLKPRNLMIQRSRKLLQTYLYTAILSDARDENEAAEYANREDPATRKAVDLLQKGEAFPTKPSRK